MSTSGAVVTSYVIFMIEERRIEDYEHIHEYTNLELSKSRGYEEIL